MVTGYRRALQAARKQIKTQRPDVIIGGRAGIASLFALGLGTLYRIPTVIQLGGNPAKLYRDRRIEFRRRREFRQVLKYSFLTLVTWFLYRYASGFLVVSEALKREITPLVNCNPDKIEIVRVPIDHDHYATADGTAWRDRFDGDRLVVTVTNLAFEGKYEGVRETVDAMLPVLEADPEITYAVAGDGLYLESLRAYVDRAVDPHLRDRIQLLGFVDDVAGLYAAADLVVYLSSVDGYPNVVREAQATGRAVVATPSHGVAEQIEDGVDGVLVETTGEELTAAIDRLLTNPDERERLGENAQRRVAEENDPETIGAELLAALDRLR
ncbi:glycosyltransferase family 4 protein [Halapricum salinum]|nr:glycosyltransferase family 4 protein [Halapricum salinum]